MTNDLKLLFWNCNGINGKTHVLENLLRQKNPDIFALTETKLKHTTHDNEISRNYTLYRYDRNIDLGFGGGVLIGISHSCDISVLNCNKFNRGEIISLELSISGLTFLLAVYYRRPSLQSIDDIINWYGETQNPNTLIIGDFNVPGIHWLNGIGTIQKNNHLQRSFLEFLNVNDLLQLVSVPTHDKGNILDLIVTNMNVSPPTVESGFSDHCTIEFCVPIKTTSARHKHNSSNKLPFWIFSRANHDSINRECLKLDRCISDDIDQNRNTDLIWEKFKSETLKIAHNHIPQCNRKKRHNFWITSDTIRNIRKRKRMFKVKMQHPTSDNMTSYKAQARLCKKLLNKDYNNYINLHICDKLASGDTKPLYRFISQKQGTSNDINKLDGCLTDEPVEISESFADAFSSVFSQDDGKFLSLPSPGNVQSEGITFNKFGILKQLQILNPRKGAGPDQLAPALLKFLAPYIYHMLTELFQYFYDTSSTPYDWRLAHVVPIFKKGSKSDPLNYRPISLTSVLSKLFEHILAHNIHQHLDLNKILHKDQHGFRAKHGCDTQLLNTVTDLIELFDSNTTVDIAVLDFSKAFDVVSHRKLSLKLTAVGIFPATIAWIVSWLLNRQLIVTVNGARSSPRSVTSGVPQGSVLGPLLFLIYINDMPDSILSSSLKLFADDSLVYHPINSSKDIEALQLDLDNLGIWSSGSQMKFNVSKCEHMRVSRNTNASSVSYTLDSKHISTVSQIKYLGIIIDHRLTFDSHIVAICGKATRILHMLMRSLKKAKTRTRVMAYKTLCRPILEYASQSWSPHLVKHIKLLESVNRKAFRWCYNLRKYDHISDLMVAFNWSSLEVRRFNSDLHMYARILNDQAIVNKNLFLPNRSCHNTRYGGAKGVTETNTKKYSFASRIRGAFGNL